jgi:hypothetical protein
MTVFSDLSGGCHPGSIEHCVISNRMFGFKEYTCHERPKGDENFPLSYQCYRCCFRVEVEIGYHTCNNEQSKMFGCAV